MINNKTKGNEVAIDALFLTDDIKY